MITQFAICRASVVFMQHGPVPLDPSLVGLRCGIVDVEDSRSVVHRSAQHPHEGQRREILCRIPFRPCVPFHAPRPFACHHVGPRASYPRLLYRLVYVEHDPVFRRRFHDPLIVLHSILRMMEVTAFESPCISRFERVNPQFGIPPHRCFHDGFVLRIFPPVSLCIHSCTPFSRA